MNFAPFNVLEFDGAFPQFTIASWLPTFTQPGRAFMYAAGTSLAIVQVIAKVIPRIPDPWRATSIRPGPAPRKAAVIRAPAGIVSSPPIFAYKALPAAPSNVGYSIISVPDPRRGTSTPLSGPFKPFIIPEFLSWQPTFVQAKRPILYAPGTDHVKDVWRFPEAVSADKWLSPPPQPSRKISYAPGTTFATSPAEVIFADKWQPTVVQPSRQILRAAGTDSVHIRELVTADKYAPTYIQPVRPTVRAAGISSVVPVWTLDTVADLAVCEGRLTLVSGQPLGNGSGTTLYFTPHRGNLIGFQQGQIISFSETSIAIPAPTGVYDVFAYNNSGTLALEFSSAWSTTGDGTGADGTRANAISLTNGVYYKSSDATRRYLGTIYSLSGTSYDISGGVGTLGKRYVWNYYNRIRKVVVTIDTTPNWTYASSVVRPANNNVNSLSSFKVVCGVSEDVIEANVIGNFTAGAAGTNYSPSIGYDQNTAASSGSTWFGGASQWGGNATEPYTILENIGLHTFWYLESSPQNLTVTVFSDGQGSQIYATHWC